MNDLEMKGVDVAEKRADREARVEGERIKAEGMERGARVKNEMDIKKASDEWGAVETLVGDFLKANPGNVHGVGAPLTGSQQDRIRTREFQRALELMMTSGFTGATATDRQIEQIQGMIQGDFFEVTDEAFRTRMNEILNIASSRRRFYQNQLGSADKRIGDPQQGLKTFTPE